MGMNKNFYVAQDVLDAGVKIVFVVMRNIDNTKYSDEWNLYRTNRLHALYEAYKDLDVKQDAILEGFNILHDKTGIKRRKNIPASENLIKLLKKGSGELFSINQAVDIYNLVSLESKLALGAHDYDKTEGNVTLRFTNGTEQFQPLGQSEPVNAAEHEYSYIDDANDVLCRAEIRQVQKTAVTEDAKNVWYIVQGNEATSNELLMQTARQIIDLTSQYCGGEGEIIVPEVK